MYTDAKWHPKSSTFRLSCSYVEGGYEIYGEVVKKYEIYGEVVKKKGYEPVTPYTERKENDGIYGVIMNGITEAESRAILMGIISYLRTIHDCANPRPLIIFTDNESAVAEFNLCFNGLVGRNFFSGRSSRLSHLQAKILCEFYRLPVTVIWVEKELNISDRLSRLNLGGKVPWLKCNTFELLELDDARDAQKNYAARTFGVRTRDAFEAYATLVDMPEKAAIWMRKAEEISREEYSALYNSLTNDLEEQLAFKHFSVEEFKAILFVPKRPPLDLYDIKHKPTNIKLYFRGFFVMDDDLVPDYLSFVNGIVDSDHRPLEAIRENLVKKCIELFFEIAEIKEVYDRFYEAYSKKIKVGLIDDAENRGKLAELLRYPSTKSGEEMTSLKDYVTRMKEGQSNIFFYITRGNIEAVENCPRLGWLKSNGYEVLFLAGYTDWCIVCQLQQFQGKKFLRALE